ncbi:MULTISPECIES: sensor histidine kinase [unclassified Paraflavitalea]|uniref:sensor histidine kinase n=1 Tax=unclassified Paraflavitalea TaxID=2798305 RepID=UPI003D345083
MNRIRESNLQRMLKKLLLALFLLSSVKSLTAQQLPVDSVRDVATIRLYDNINRLAVFNSKNIDQVEASELQNLEYQHIPYTAMNPSMPDRFLEHKLIMCFAVTNTLPIEKEVYFSPGYYHRNFELYYTDKKAGVNSPIPVPEQAEDDKYFKGSRLLTIQPGDTIVYFAEMNFIRTNANHFNPCIIEKDFIKSWAHQLKFRDTGMDMMTYIFAGMMLLMVFYSLSLFSQNRNNEFLYYAIYATCSTFVFFFKTSAIGLNVEWNFLYEEYYDFLGLVVGVIFYLIFMSKFLNTKTDHPFLYKFFKVTMVILGLMFLVFTCVYFFTTQYVLLYIIENYVTKVFMFVTGIVFIVYGLRKKDALIKYLAAGNIALLVFSVLSLMTIFKIKFSADKFSLFNRGLFYYEAGVALELLAFLLGLSYKNRVEISERAREKERLLLEKERNEFEKQLAIATTRQEERDRISADMHDELGSGMTAIRLMSEIMRTKIKDDKFPELERISNASNDLLGKMNSIIWTMKSSNDSLESLIAYVRSHTLEYFDNTEINCRVALPNSIPNVEMSGEKRRNIFLSIKESLNNILKHAHATEVSMGIEINTDKKTLAIRVTDNGVGIDQEKLKRFGNGLSNMKRRMEMVEGSLEVNSSDQGTTILFVAPF